MMHRMPGYTARGKDNDQQNLSKKNDNVILQRIYSNQIASDVEHTIILFISS